MTGASGSRVSSVNQTLIVSKYAFLNYFRAKRFYVMLLITGLITGLLTFAAAYYRPAFFGFNPVGTTDPHLAFFSAFWGGFAPLVVVLSASFFGGDAITSEVQNKTGFFLIPNPVRRSAIYAGKWLAALAASTLILAIYALVTVANGAYFFGGDIPVNFYESVLFAWFYLVAALGLTFMFSSLFKSSAISVLMTAILLLFGFNVIDTIAGSVAHIEPWFSITYGAGIIQDILMAVYPMGTTVIQAGPRGFTLTEYAPSVAEGMVILLGYFLISAILGLVLFERREFT